MPSQEGTSLGTTQDGYCDFCPFGGPPNPNEDSLSYDDVDYEAVKEAAQRGHCQICARIVKFLKTQEQEPAKLCYSLDPVLGMRLSLIFSDGSTYPARPTYEFFTKKEDSAGGITPSDFMEFFFGEMWHMRRRGLYLNHTFGEIFRLRAPSGDTCSTTAFETLNHWISRCKAEHTQCQPVADKTLPHRILEIVSINPLRIRLVENCTERENYACLSHRWGPQTRPNSLSKQNLDLYKAEIPENKLYPLVRDAIAAIIRLDLRFIWIDCYCIIQDDLSDWEAEAANMASIFENAFLTISATSSEDGCSMFSPMSKEFEDFQVTEIRGVPIYIRSILPHPYRLQGDLTNSEFVWGSSLRRGWVFQERLLSNRFIHFTTSEIFWECRESTWCECDSRAARWEYQRKEKARTVDGQGWDLIAEQYNGTQLSFDRDRLPALAGVAQRYAELRGGLTYLAGLWKEDLPAALGWHKYWSNDLYRSDEERPIEQIAPSWSWASLPRGESLSVPWRRESVSTLVGCKINPPGADIYTGAKWAELTIEGPTLDLVVDIDSDGYMIGRHGNGFLMIVPDFKIDPEDDTKSRAVVDGSRCLLLLLRYYDDIVLNEVDNDVTGIVLLPQSSSADGEDSKFERIGFFGFGWDEVFADGPADPEPEWKRPPAQWFLDRAKTRQVTLI